MIFELQKTLFSGIQAPLGVFQLLRHVIGTVSDVFKPTGVVWSLRTTSGQLKRTTSILGERH